MVLIVGSTGAALRAVRFPEARLPGHDGALFEKQSDPLQGVLRQRLIRLALIRLEMVGIVRGRPVVLQLTCAGLRRGKGIGCLCSINFVRTGKHLIVPDRSFNDPSDKCWSYAAPFVEATDDDDRRGCRLLQYSGAPQARGIRGDVCCKVPPRKWRNMSAPLQAVRKGSFGVENRPRALGENRKSLLGCRRSATSCQVRVHRRKVDQLADDPPHE